MRYDMICTFCFDDGLYMLGGDIVFYVYCFYVFNFLFHIMIHWL